MLSIEQQNRLDVLRAELWEDKIKPDSPEWDEYWKLVVDNTELLEHAFWRFQRTIEWLRKKLEEVSPNFDEMRFVDPNGYRDSTSRLHFETLAKLKQKMENISAKRKLRG